MKKKYCQKCKRTDRDICGYFSIPVEIMAQKCDSDFFMCVCVCVSLTEFFFTDKNISSSPE